MSELKPCPFCGGYNVKADIGGNFLGCKDCLAEAHKDYWQKRPGEDAAYEKGKSDYLKSQSPESRERMSDMNKSPTEKQVQELIPNASILAIIERIVGGYCLCKVKPLKLSPQNNKCIDCGNFPRRSWLIDRNAVGWLTREVPMNIIPPSISAREECILFIEYKGYRWVECEMCEGSRTIGKGGPYPEIPCPDCNGQGGKFVKEVTDG